MVGVKFVRASVAQWIEHWPPKPRVASSNLARCAIRRCSSKVEQWTFNPSDEGSNPSAAIMIKRRNVC